MTDKEYIIIDGMNVSRCKFFNDITESYYCFGIPCKDRPNCYFKQLARKTQECEELRVAYNKAQDIIGRVNGANELKSYSLQESIKECDRYRKALEEIEEIAKSFNKNELCFYKEINECDCCDMGADCNYLRRVKILYIINTLKEKS